jgi:hypothetical protein
MHAKNFCLEFLNIFKNNFRSAGAYTPMSQTGFPYGTVLISFQSIRQPNHMGKSLGCLHVRRRVHKTNQHHTGGRRCVADSEGSDNRTVGPTRSPAHGRAAGRTRGDWLPTTRRTRSNRSSPHPFTRTHTDLDTANHADGQVFVFIFLETIRLH